MKNKYIVPTTTAEKMQISIPLCTSGIDYRPNYNGATLSKREQHNDWDFDDSNFYEGNVENADVEKLPHYSPWDD